MNQPVDSLDLENVEIRVDPVVCFRFSKGLNETFSFVFSNPLLREVHLARDVIDEVSFHSFVWSVHGKLKTLFASGDEKYRSHKQED